MTELYTLKQSTTYPDLYVRKYKRKVFYNNLWNLDTTLLESRGHVFNSRNELVVNPPTKVFNRNENGTDINLTETCVAVRKVNGFMACVTWVPKVNDVVVSTTGSLDSDYVQMARSMMPYAIDVIRNSAEPITYFFEICHPNDPHIIPENIGVYLLGKRRVNDTAPYFTTSEQEAELDLIASKLQVIRPKWVFAPFEDIVYDTKYREHEGYMVYGQTSNTVLKLKSPYYLSLKAIARKKDILSLRRNRVDEEYYPLLDHLTTISKSFNLLSEQEKLTYIRDYLYETRD